MTEKKEPPVLLISEGEHEVLLELTRNGAENADIAKHLGIPVDTVKSRIRRVMRESGCTNRTDLALALVTRRVRTQIMSPYQRRKHMYIQPKEDSDAATRQETAAATRWCGE